MAAEDADDRAACRFPRGTLVLGLLGAANRDPSQFAEPDRLDLGRDQPRHLAFGAGIHYCLGASLARLEAQVAIGALLRRFPALTLAVERPVWRPSSTLRGLDTLPVTLGPTPGLVSSPSIPAESSVRTEGSVTWLATTPASGGRPSPCGGPPPGRHGPCMG